MHVWHATLNGHHYCGHAIVFAETKAKALKLLYPAIAAHGLKKVWDIRKLIAIEPCVFVLDDVEQTDNGGAQRERHISEGARR